MIAPKESVRKMKPYSGPGEGRMGTMRLDFNENLLGASPKVAEAIAKVTREEYGCYPEYEELYRALSAYLGVREECVIACNGSDEAIKVLFDVYVEKGDEVILLAPSYSMYELYAEVAGAKIVWVSYLPGFIFPIEEILKQIGPKTRFIAIANPNNPTGTLIAREDLVKIIEKNPQMAVLIDEAYVPYAKTTNLDLALSYPNVFAAQTFSKGHGLAGLRIGYLVSAVENIESVSKVLSPSYSVDCLAAAAAIAAMEDSGYVERYVEEVIAAREFFVEEIKKLGFEAVSSSANFVLVRFNEKAERAKEALAKENILVRKRSDLPGYLRITIGPRVQMEKVLSILRSEFTALIFDMDGVLVDESRSYRPCIAKTAESFLEMKIDSAVVESLKAKGGYNNDYDCTEAILKQNNVSVARREIEERFDAFYEEFKLAETWLLDESVLLRLKEKYRLGIFTGRPKKDARDALMRFRKESFFEIVVTDDDVKERKPSPEGLFLALEKLGAVKAVYVGDSRDDAEAAKRAGVPFIAVGTAGTALKNINELETFL